LNSRLNSECIRVVPKETTVRKSNWPYRHRSDKRKSLSLSFRVKQYSCSTIVVTIMMSEKRVKSEKQKESRMKKCDKKSLMNSKSWCLESLGVERNTKKCSWRVKERVFFLFKNDSAVSLVFCFLCLLSVVSLVLLVVIFFFQWWWLTDRSHPRNTGNDPLIVMDFYSFFRFLFPSLNTQMTQKWYFPSTQVWLK
jgi:Na+/melibiose symporter-like transporter